MPSLMIMYRHRKYNVVMTDVKYTTIDKLADGKFMHPINRQNLRAIIPKEQGRRASKRQFKGRLKCPPLQSFYFIDQSLPRQSPHTKTIREVRMNQREVKKLKNPDRQKIQLLDHSNLAGNLVRQRRNVAIPCQMVIENDTKVFSPQRNIASTFT